MMASFDLQDVRKVIVGNRRESDISEGDAMSAKLKKATPKFLPNKELAKVTLYLRPDQVIAIESIQLQERKRTGIRPDKSDLVQEAIDLLVSKYKQAR